MKQNEKESYSDSWMDTVIVRINNMKNKMSRDTEKFRFSRKKADYLEKGAAALLYFKIFY